MTEDDLKKVQQIIHREVLAASSRWLETKDAEIYAGRGRKNLERLRRDCGLRPHRNGRKVIYDKLEIDRLLEQL